MNTGYLDNSVIKDIDRYLLNLIPARDAVLDKMEQYAIEKKFPFIGPLVGNVLSLLAKSIQAKDVFELGSGFGYSAVHFARAIPENGKVICTDGDAENERMAKQFFAEAKLAHKTEFFVGDAVQSMSKFSGPFDIILMDIDKHGYPDGFRHAWPKLRAGGLFITDNMLWHGAVLNHEDQSPNTIGVRELTKLLYSTPNAQTTILPLRDGVSVTLKTA